MDIEVKNNRTYKDVLFDFLKIQQSNVVLAISIVLITIISFNLGQIAERNSLKTPISIKDGPGVAEVGDRQRTVAMAGQIVVNKDRTNLTVVASKKSSTKYYHFTWCPGASKIAPANKITFSNESAAITAGFTLASNCQR